MRAITFLLLAGVAGLGCSSPSDAAPSSRSCKPFDYASYQPSSTPRSFANDVVPILGRSCTFSVCHGSLTNTQAGLYLGPNINNTSDKPTAQPPYYPPDADTITQILGNVVGATAVETNDMPLVAASDPAHSYLMHKLDGDQSCSGLTCVDLEGKPDKTCGARMPQDQPALLADDLATIRDWIAQGAKND